MQRFAEWLLNITQKFLTRDIKTGVENGRRMCTVLTVLCLLSKLPCKHKYKDNIINLFGCLHFEPQIVTPNKWVVPEMKVLKIFIPQDFYSNLADCLVDYVNLVTDINHIFKAQWLSVVVLIHLLKNTDSFSESCEGPQVFNITQWSDTHFRLPSNQSITTTFNKQPR